jgi:DNA-binding XRE family transcriptional regulator
MKKLNKYFWGLNNKALDETKNILNDLNHPKHINRLFTLLSRCDNPNELFSFISKKLFIKSWPKLRRYWRKINQAKDFMLWWESIYEQLIKKKQGNYSAPLEELINIGASIRQTRIEKGLSQAALAKVSGINQPDISKIEKGKGNITLLTLIRLCRTLEITDLPIHQQ